MTFFLIQIVLYAVEFAIYVVPLAAIYILLHWHQVNEMVRRAAERQLTAEFGTSDVHVGSATLVLGFTGKAAWCELKDCRVGEDFLHIKSMRVTAASFFKFMSLYGPQLPKVLGVPWFMFGSVFRDFESIEVDGCHLHVAAEGKNMAFYTAHIAAQRKAELKALMEGKAELHAWRRKWVGDEDASASGDASAHSSFDGAPEAASSSSSPPPAPSDENDRTLLAAADDSINRSTNVPQRQSSQQPQSAGLGNSASSQAPSSPKPPPLSSSSSVSSPAGSPTTRTVDASLTTASLDHDSDVDDDGDGQIGQSFDNEDEDDGPLEDGEEDLGDAGAYGIEEVAFLGSISGRVGQLSRAYKKSLLRRGRKKEESREKREWMSMCRRVEEGSTVRCGMVRCTDFEIHVKDRSLKLAKAWELRGFVGTWPAFKHAVLYDVKPSGGGLLPTMVKNSGTEAVGAFQKRVAVKRLAVERQVAERVGSLKGYAAESKVLQGLGQRFNRFRGRNTEPTKVEDAEPQLSRESREAAPEIPAETEF